MFRQILPGRFDFPKRTPLKLLKNKAPYVARGLRYSWQSQRIERENIMLATESAVLPWQRQSVTGTQPVPAHTAAHTATQQALSEPERGARDTGGFKPFGDDGFGFLDLIDVINPLQHIPLVGTLYREFTGDEIGALPRIAGSTLFFGPIGAAVSGANVVLETASGKDVGDHVMALLRDEGSGLQQAQADSASPEAHPHEVAVVAGEPVAAGTDAAPGFALAADDPVSAWARSELAYRQALANSRAIAGRKPETAPEAPVASAAPALAPTAKAETAAVPDLRASDTALWSAANAAYGKTAETSPARQRASLDDGNGAAAPGGGWFAANMLQSLNRYHRQQMALDAAPETTKPSAIN